MNLAAGVRRLRFVLDPTRRRTGSAGESEPENLFVVHRVEEHIRLQLSPEAVRRPARRPPALPPELPSRLATGPEVAPHSNGSGPPDVATLPGPESSSSEAAVAQTLNAARNGVRRLSRLRLRRTESPTETADAVEPGLTESFMRMMF
jgi:hypothetical protein